MAIQWEDINSSNIKRAGYHLDLKLLLIEFQNGSEYEYKNVEQSVYDELIKAESPGTYFAKNIRSVYEFRKL